MAMCMIKFLALLLVCGPVANHKKSLELPAKYLSGNFSICSREFGINDNGDSFIDLEN